MLEDKGLTLDGVIELKVDDGMLLDRIEKRAGETKARGEPVRADDNPETLKRRLAAYYAQTAPLADYYARKGRLSSLDGMASIDRVAGAIDTILEATKVPLKRARKPAAKSRPAVQAKAGSRIKTSSRPKPAAKRKAAKKPVKSGAAKRQKPARGRAARKPSGRR
jgi:adenylate kinase